MIHWKQIIITVFTFSHLLPRVSACGEGWFGTNCEYQCHCSTATCDSNGECQSGKCASGWFGPACQYQNLYSQQHVATSSPTVSSLTDTDDQTCSTVTTGTLTVILNMVYPITWIRLVVKIPEQLRNITILLNDTQDSVATCSRTVMQDRTMDVICDVSVAVNKISFRGNGVNPLCSLYISGGRNVAVKQMTSQSSNYSEYPVTYDSSRAVDGKTDSEFTQGSCSHTQEEIASNWNVTFSRPRLVNRYLLYNRNSLQERLLNFSLLSFNPDNNVVINYSIPPKQLIYTVTSPPELVSYVKIFTNFTRILTLCEVEIYGDSACASNTFGVDCNKTCNCLNQTESCFVATGGCTSGCALGYYRDDCQTECPSDKWGYNCNDSCSTRCRNNSCNGTTGICYGCEDGYTGGNCSQECPPLKWGLNCQSNCTENCLKGSCNNTNGICNFGCLPGYINKNCSSECPYLKWGPECLGNCSINCANKTCDNVDGKCDNGCEAGYNGDNCTQTCPALYWGPNCSLSCSEHCFNKTCNRFNGTCDMGCQAGYLGERCVDACAPSKWGPQCKNNCSGHCLTEPCNVTSGWCDSGCETGYTHANCSIQCPSLTWGRQCLNNCSDHCHNKTCHFKDGKCDHGCDPGYFGLLCLDECPISKWGDNCHLNCSLQCNNQTCSRNNGTCDYGCTSGYVGRTCFDKLVEDESTPAAAIVVPIVVGLIVMVLIITAVFIVRRRRRAKSNANQEQLSKEMLFVSSKHFNGDDKNNPPDRGSKSFTALPGKSGPENIYSNTALPTAKNTSIAVNDLNEFMHLHNSDYFTDQFKNIPPPTNVSMEVGLSDANKHKNRYKNICTYDHSRVHLKIDTSRNEGDYINASYIEGYMDKDKFIASQGPNKVILNDFVRLLWEQKVDKVVMLTNLIEEGQVKCERYWPEEGKIGFGHIKVRLASTQVFADYTIRKLELIKKDEPIQHMTQFHFTSWPDKGVPLTPWSLVDFEQRVASEPTTSPVVVHCSAGVGRTGTFIALCNVMKEAEDAGRIDFYKTVVKLRQDRVMMIQTPAQYEFLHRAAQVAIVCMGTTVTSRDITDRIRVLEQEDFKGRTKMEIEFQAVCLVSEDFTKHIKDVENTEQESSVYENNVNNSAMGKNRFPDILPEKSYCALLIPDGSQSGDYINAVIVPSLKKKDQQVLTQLPLAATVVDFWRLVMDYKVSLIVEFEFSLQSTDPTIADYLPSMPGESLTFGTNEIHMLSSKKSAVWEELQLSIRTKKKSTHLTSFDQLKVFLLKCFFTELDVKNLLLLVKHIRSCKSPGEERVLYMCRDGARYSGLACVLTLLLDRMDNDLRLTVPLVVGAMKSIRPQVIPTVDQYRILYQVLHRYNETTSSYTNFGDYQQMNLLLATDNLDKSKFMDSENIYSNT